MHDTDAVRRGLIVNNIRCCSARGPVLTVHHCQERLQYTMQCQNWRN